MSMVSTTWLKRQMLNLKLRKIDELLDLTLILNAANGTTIPYLGFMEVKVRLPGKDKIELDVSMLVTPQDCEFPILGYNVIAEFVQTSTNKPGISNIFNKTFDAQVCTDTTKLVSLIEESSRADNYSGTIKITRRDIMVPKGGKIKLSCRANYLYLAEKTPALFEPVENNVLPPDLMLSESIFYVQPGISCRLVIEVTNSSERDIVVPKHTELGHIQLFKSVTPIQVRKKESSENTIKHPVPSENLSKSQKTCQMNSVSTEAVIPDITLGNHLTDDQCKQIKQLLADEADSFSKGTMMPAVRKIYSWKLNYMTNVQYNIAIAQCRAHSIVK